MPGGFVGYGVRAFDRMTAMGVDYSGGMWKIRGRVAEVFDPATEASRGAQRRPQGQGPPPPTGPGAGREGPQGTGPGSQGQEPGVNGGGK